MLHEAKSITLTAALCIALTALAGCSYKKQFESGASDYGSRQLSAPDQAYDTRPHGLSMQSASDHQNRTLVYSKSASDAIADMKGIREAFVFITDKNAYAAIVLDQSATGMVNNGKQGLQISDNSITSNQFHRIPQNSVTLRPGTVATDKYSYATAEKTEDLSSELRAQAEARVRELHPQLNGIFISANIQYVNEMSILAHEAWRGKGLHGYVEQFNALSQDMFSTAIKNNK
jgi:hypothetical protein